MGVGRARTWLLWGVPVIDTPWLWPDGSPVLRSCKVAACRELVGMPVEVCERHRAAMAAIRMPVAVDGVQRRGRFSTGSSGAALEFEGRGG